MNRNFVALLRGVNVGGNKKVPMAELKSLMAGLGFEDVKTLLNSGNVVFNAGRSKVIELEKIIAASLEKHFGFSVPVLVRSAEDFLTIAANPAFENISVTKDSRLYISFLKNPDQIEFANEPELPKLSEDGSFTIKARQNGAIYSMLDVSRIKTPDAMQVLEKIYGKYITTRNLNTVQKIAAICRS